MMTAKEYLQQIYHLDRKIKRLEAKREAIRADLYSVKSTTDYNADRVQTSVEGDTMLRLIAKVDSIERDIVTELERAVVLKDKISKQIEQLDDETAKDILSQRYIEFLSFDEIAINLHYSRRHIDRLHGRALYLFRKDVLECPK